MQRAYFYFSAGNSLPYLDLKVYKSYKFNFGVYSFVAQRVMVNLRYFPGLTDFLLILRFQLLRQLGNFFICQQVRFLLVSVVSVQFFR
jgi:hypothetical protein